MSDEIWVVRGRKPVLWTMPYRVHWFGAHAELRRVLPPLLAHQERALMEFFEEHHGCRFTLNQLKAVASPLPTGLNPEESFSWERPRLAQQPKFKPERRQERDEFLDAVYQRGLGQSRDEVEYWWNQFCNAMLDWLINKERPIDLYFLKLHPVPFREHWEKRVLGFSQQKRRYRGLAKLIESGALFAMDGTTCQRRVEVELTRWRKLARGVEKERLNRLGRAGYAKAIIEAGLAQIPASERIYRQFQNDFKKESILFLPGSLGGAGGWAENHGGRRMGALVAKLRRLARRTAFKPRPRPRQNVRRSKSRVSILRAIQSREADLRERREYLPPAWFIKESAARVLVLLAAEKRDPDQLLAVRPHEGPAGLVEEAKQLSG